MGGVDDDYLNYCYCKKCYFFESGEYFSRYDKSEKIRARADNPDFGLNKDGQHCKVCGDFLFYSHGQETSIARKSDKYKEKHKKWLEKCNHII